MVSTEKTKVCLKYQLGILFNSAEIHIFNITWMYSAESYLADHTVSTDSSIWNKLMGCSVLWQQWWHKKIHWQCLCEMAFQYVFIRDHILSAQSCDADSCFPFYSSLTERTAVSQMLKIRCWDYKLKRKIRICIYLNIMH